MSNEEEYVYSNNENQNEEEENVYSNNENHEEKLHIKETIEHIEEVISFYNGQKKILKNLYKDFLSKNKELRKIENNKLHLEKNVIAKHGNIKSKRVQSIYNKELKEKNNDIKRLKNEKNEITTSIKIMIENNNILFKNNVNNVNPNALKLKPNNFISKLKQFSDIIKGKIVKLNSKISQIHSVLGSKILSKNNINKTSISLIYDLTELLNDSDRSSIFCQEIDNLIDNANEKYKKSKEYKDFVKENNVYMELLVENNELISNTLQQSLDTRNNLREKVNGLINELTQLVYNNRNIESKITEISRKIQEIERIRNYKCIELTDEILNNFEGLKMYIAQYTEQFL